MWRRRVPQNTKKLTIPEVRSYIPTSRNKYSYPVWNRSWSCGKSRHIFFHVDFLDDSLHILDSLQSLRILHIHLRISYMILLPMDCFLFTWVWVDVDNSIFTVLTFTISKSSPIHIYRNLFISANLYFVKFPRVSLGKTVFAMVNTFIQSICYCC